MSFKNIWLIIAIPAVALIGYGLMKLLVIGLPVDNERTGAQVIVSIAIPVLGLIIPYFMLKLGFFDAHLHNAKEKNIRLSDIPKDKKQLAEGKAREV